MRVSGDLGGGCFAIGEQGSVKVCPPVTVALDDGDTRASIDVPGIGLSNWVEAWISEQWVCVVGLAAPEVVIANYSSAGPEIVGILDRLDLADAYDPGGLHRVAFHPLPGASDLLIEHEHGVARLDVGSRRLRWQQVHGDVTARVMGVDTEHIWLTSETDNFGYRISDGAWASSRF